MSKMLNEYRHPDTKEGFGNHFSQYTKKGLATYTKLSYFSHGNGQSIQEMYEHQLKIAFAYQ